MHAKVGGTAMTKSVYFFGGGTADGGKELRELLGGKGAHLAEMARLGLPVPPGFTISTEVCAAFSSSGAVPGAVKEEIAQALSRLESAAGRAVWGAGEPAAPPGGPGRPRLAAWRIRSSSLCERAPAFRCPA